MDGIFSLVMIFVPSVLHLVSRLDVHLHSQKLFEKKDMAISELVSTSRPPESVFEVEHWSSWRKQLFVLG